MPESERTYISIDLKSFYAPVECVERTGRDVIPKAALVTPPLTDFWRVGRGIARKLEEHCISFSRTGGNADLSCLTA